MTIEITTSPKIKFERLKPKDVFVSVNSDEVYMRISDIIGEFQGNFKTVYNVVNLKTGIVSHFMKDHYVIPYPNAKVVIE